MKKIIFLVFICLSMGTITFAQTEVKVKKTSTIPQKVHNTFSKHKRYNGTVVKTKSPTHKRKHKVTAKKEMIKTE